MLLTPQLIDVIIQQLDYKNVDSLHREFINNPMFVELLNYRVDRYMKRYTTDIYNKYEKYSIIELILKCENETKTIILIDLLIELYHVDPKIHNSAFNHPYIPCENNSALIAASLKGASLVVQHLIVRHGVDVNDHSSGYTTLMIATMQGNIEMVSLLLSLGADVNADNGNGGTALKLPIIVNSQNYIPIATLLLKAGANINHKGASGNSAMCLAKKFHNDEYCNNVEIIQFLIDHGAVE